MNKNILTFFNDMYNREIAKRESIFMPARNDLILIEFNLHEESKLKVGYMPVDGYSTHQVNAIAEDIMTSLLGLSLTERDEAEDGETLGRANGDFTFKGKPIHYIVLATNKGSQSIEIDISFSA